MTTARPHHLPEQLPRGLVIDGWLILNRLDTGGFGAVYLVEKEGVRAALKMARIRAAAPPQDAGRTEERTLRELVCLLRLHHLNVVRVLAHGRWPDPLTGYVYFVMEFVEGDSLKVWARRNVPTLHEALRLFVKLADALEAAHRLGILHRDIKPANVRVRRDGEPKMLDFGAGDFPQADPLTGEVLPPGTITHRSPEAVRFEREHENDPRARYEFQPADDLYALGATFYEVLTGRAPFQLEPSPVGPKRLAVAIEHHDPPAPHALNPHVPVALSQIVMRLLAKDPTERHASAGALRRDLASLDNLGVALDAPLRAPDSPRAQEAPSVDTPPIATPPAVVRARRVHRAVDVLALVGMVAVLALGAFFLTREAGAPSQAPTLTSNEARTEPRPSAPPSPSRAPSTTPPATEIEPPAMLNAAPEQEGPTVKTPPTATRKSPAPAAPKTAPGTSSLKEACRALMVGSAAWLAAGCAGAQVRPEPAACPEEAIRAMRELNWHKSIVGVNIDINQPDDGTDVAPNGFYRSGPVISQMTEADDGNAPAGTLLLGRLWVDEKGSRFYGRWTEAVLPGGRKVPVCLELHPDGPFPISDPYGAGLVGPGVVEFEKIRTLYTALPGWR